jgi:hypothetical protein
VGSMTMSSEATQNATEQRKRILRSRALKWSRNGGSFLFFLNGVDAVAVVLVFCNVGELPLCDSFSCVEPLFSRSTDIVVVRDAYWTRIALMVVVFVPTGAVGLLDQKVLRPSGCDSMEEERRNRP